MPRNSRKSLICNFFHVIVQGLNKEFIFDDDLFIKKYIYLLFKYSKKYDVNILSYCIMNNHAHILTHSKNITNLSLFMKDTNSNYAKYYNFKKDRVGYVFKGRFLSEPISNESHLLNCISYIHNNPVKAFIVEKCEDYKYSSYNDFILKKGFVTNDIIKLLFGNSKDYIHNFKLIHKQKCFFLDIDINFHEILDQKIQEFISYKNISQNQILENNEILKEFINYAKNNSAGVKIKNIDIAKKLNIPPYTINRLAKKM